MFKKLNYIVFLIGSLNFIVFVNSFYLCLKTSLFIKKFIRVENKIIIFSPFFLPSRFNNYINIWYNIFYL